MQNRNINPSKAAKFFYDAILFCESGNHYANNYNNNLREFNKDYWNLHGRNISKAKAIVEYEKLVEDHKLIATTEHQNELWNLIEWEQLVLTELRNLKVD